MKCDPTYTVPVGYEDNYRKAALVFKYQLVFDPRSKRAVPLNEIDEEFSVEDMNYIGPYPLLPFILLYLYPFFICFHKYHNIFNGDIPLKINTL